MSTGPATVPSPGLHGLAAGFHAVARLPDTVDEEAVVANARTRSIGLHGMSGYRSSGATHPPQLVLGFGNLSDDSIERGISAVRDLLSGDEVRRAGRSNRRTIDHDRP